MTSESNDMRKLMNGPCLRIVPGRVNTLLIGDSHAAHFWAGLADTLPNANVLQATASGCVPVVGASGAPRCTALMEEIFSKFIPQHKGEIDAVILSGRWKATDGPRLIETIQQIRQSIPTVYVFGPIAEYDLPLPSLLARGVYFKNPDLHKEFLVPDRKILDHSMEASLAGSGATYISVYDKICPIGGECATLDHNGMPLQFDSGPLTHATTRGLACKLFGEVGKRSGLKIPVRTAWQLASSLWVVACRLSQDDVAALRIFCCASVQQSHQGCFDNGGDRGVAEEHRDSAADAPSLKRGRDTTVDLSAFSTRIQAAIKSLPTLRYIEASVTFPRHSIATWRDILAMPFPPPHRRGRPLTAIHQVGQLK